MKKLIFILVVLALAVPSFGELMAELNYDETAFPFGIQDKWDYLSDAAIAEGGWDVDEWGTPSPVPDPFIWPTVPGPWGYAARIDGTKHSFLHMGVAGVTTQGRITMDIAPNWAGATGVGTGNIQWLYCTGDGGNPNAGVMNIYFDGNDIDVKCYASAGQNKLEGPLGSTTGWAAGSWHNITVEWNATDVFLIVDNVLVDQEAKDVQFVGSTNGAYIFGHGAAGGINTFQGLADNIRIYDNAEPTAASLPSPASPSTVYYTDEGATLSWREGIGVYTSHKVYWSDVEADVTGRTVTPIVLAIGTETTATPSTPSIGTDYYWAVDEVNSLGVTTAGPLWTYTTEDFFYVDDMEGYDLSGDTPANEIWNVWVDGYPGSGGLDNGSALVGTTDAFPGGAGTGAMEYKYSNEGTSPYGPATSKYYSETAADTSNLECGSDWTAGGVAWLRVNFKGEAGNDPNEQMYIVIEDSVPNTAIVKYGSPDSYSNHANPGYAEDMNNITAGTWYTWGIDLRSFTGVTLSDVQNVYIGFGERGKVNDSTRSGAPAGQYQGMVIFDDIELVLSGLYGGVVESFASDLYDDGDGVINFKDFAVMANDWGRVEYDGAWPIY